MVMRPIARTIMRPVKRGMIPGMMDQPPSITSSATFNVDEGDDTIGTVTASGDAPITFSITGGADEALFSIDGSSGALTFDISTDYENPADDDDDNVYEVQVTATNAVGSDMQNIAVTVVNVVEAPTITSSATFTIDENETAVGTVTATGEGTITFSINGGVDAALFSIDEDTGELTFDVAPDYEAPGDDDEDNVYEVTVRATNAGGFDAQNVEVTVEDVEEMTLADLLATGVNAIAYDPSDLSTLWSDAARTTPAVVDGPVRVMDDISGNGKHFTASSDAARPTLRQSGGRTWLEADGTNDHMATAALNWSTVDKCFVCAGFHLDSGSDNQVLFNHGANNFVARCLQLNCGNVPDGAYNFLYRDGAGGLGFVGGSTAGHTLPKDYLVSGQTDWAQAALPAQFPVLRRDGANDSRSNVAASATATHGNLVLNLFADGGPSLFFSGNFYGLIIIPRATVLTLDEIEFCEQWMAERTGTTLP